MNQEIQQEILRQDYAKIQQNIESFLKNQVSQKKANGVVFGLSGGIDSTTIACLCSKVFKKNALALVMPDSAVSPSSDTGDALKIIGEIGIDYKLIDISEYLIGYFTKFGDGSADILPIVSLYKTQLREFAKNIGVPDNIITKKSSPNLWKGHEAEEEIGISYEEIDSVLYCLIDKKLSVDETIQKTEISGKSVEKIYQMYQKSQHKRILPERV